MKRSHTFAATSSRPLALSSALHSSPPEQRQVNGHGAVTHTPELNDVEDHHPSDEYIGCEDQTLVSRHPTRPLAYSYPLSSGESGNFRSVAGRKYGWTSSTTRLNVKPARKADREEEEASSSGVSSHESSCDHHGGGRECFRSTAPKPERDGGGESPKHGRVDILQLCHHLRTRGLGDPVMSTNSHTGNHINSLPPGVRARCLPRDPSTREKIKGRARLDYELASMRAAAFCEQQRPRTLRTASADLKNRDVRLLEEEERENLHRELNTARGRRGYGQNKMEEDDDDASSLVGSPLSREELFFRIEAWAEDVHKAINQGHS